MLNTTNNKSRMTEFAKMITLLEDIDEEVDAEREKDKLEAENKKRKEGAAQEKGGNQAAELFKKMKAGGGSKGGEEE